MLRVCHILYSGLGGHGSVVFSCLECDRKPEFAHSLLFLGVEPLLAQYQSYCESLGIAYRYLRKIPRSDLATQYAVFRTLQNWKPDVLFCHSGYAALPGCWLYRLLNPRTRFIYIEHTPNHQKGRVEWLGSRLAGWAADRVVYLTEESRSEVEQRIGWAYRPDRARVIANGINTEYFCPSDGRYPSSEVLIGMQARLTRGKDQATLIRALDCLRPRPGSPSCACFWPVREARNLSCVSWSFGLVSGIKSTFWAFWRNQPCETFSGVSGSTCMQLG